MLETGRTHEIKGINYTLQDVIGDKTYGIESENAWAQKHF